MEDRDQARPYQPPRSLRFMCPTCKHRVEVRQEDPARLPRFFPFCCERCKLIDLGAWLDADYRIPSKPDEEPEGPGSENAAPDAADTEEA